MLCAATPPRNGFLHQDAFTHGTISRDHEDHLECISEEVVGDEGAKPVDGHTVDAFACVDVLEEFGDTLECMGPTTCSP